MHHKGSLRVIFATILGRKIFLMREKVFLLIAAISGTYNKLGFVKHFHKIAKRPFSFCDTKGQYANIILTGRKYGTYKS